jgi:hypothetical protein
MAIQTPSPKIEAPPASSALEPIEHMRSVRRHRLLRGVLAGLAALIALGAIPGAIFVVPALPHTWLHQGAITPFTDFTIPALALGVLCGGGALLALVTVLVRPRIGALVAMAAGVLMVGFEVLEILVVGFTPLLYPSQPASWLQVVYLVIGASMIVLGELLWMLERNTVDA